MSIFGKLIDNIIPMVNAHILRSCGVQFGITPNYSTTHSTLVLQEVVQNYMNQGSNAYYLMYQKHLTMFIM